MMEGILFREATDRDLEAVAALSRAWAREDITYGYGENTPEILREYTLWCAADGEAVVGYLMGRRKTAQDLCILPTGSPYFEVEDFYVSPDFRSRGIGEALFAWVEGRLREDGVAYILLSTATRDAGRIQRFYTQKAGMTVWTTTLFKKIE
jgi:ribosomal protein S18 acetylase RimI-like enzyme